VPPRSTFYGTHVADISQPQPLHDYKRVSNRPHRTHEHTTVFCSGCNESRPSTLHSNAGRALLVTSPYSLFKCVTSKIHLKRPALLQSQIAQCLTSSAAVVVANVVRTIIRVRTDARAWVTMCTQACRLSSSAAVWTGSREF
jgi:hypothetical protein